jgi:hypothetical protein
VKVQKPLLTLLLTLLLASAGWAQNATAQGYIKMLPGLLQVIGMKAEMTGQMYAMAQQMGNGPEMQRCRMEAQMHQAMYQAVAALQQNPQPLANPAFQQQFLAAVNEYNYRSDTRDLRPYEQIQGELARYVAYAQWKAGTPQGRAAHQANVSQIQANTWQNTANHNMRMEAMSAQAAARNNAWQQGQARSDVAQQQYVHSIYDEYQYENPNTGQSYWVPMENSNPAVMNADGSYTELTPYHNY